MDSAIKVSVQMDAQLFRAFALYDTFVVKRRWRAPALFLVLMLVFAAMCFSQYGVTEQAALPGTVLLVVGLGLPVIYLAFFFRSIGVQIRKFGLQDPQRVYTVTLTDEPDGIRVVTKDGREERYSWDGVYGVFRVRGCTFLYPNSTRAYFLPDRDVGEQMEALETLLNKRTIAKK